MLCKAVKSQARKKPRVAATSAAAVPPSSMTHRMRLSASEPMLLKLVSDAQKSLSSTVIGATYVPPKPTIKPDDYLCRLLEKPLKLFPAASLQGFFQELTKESIDAYDLELVKAVRDENVESLREMRNSGRSMHAGNKFGETIMHAACRRGSISVLRFLLHEAGTPLQVCCDYGRTPLHDACWTPEPNWTVLNEILDECPDLLFITDRRGFTPLSYIPKEQWDDWCQFLERRGADRLQPKSLHMN